MLTDPLQKNEHIHQSVKRGINMKEITHGTSYIGSSSKFSCPIATLIFDAEVDRLNEPRNVP
jgi:hypothetical protein